MSEASLGRPEKAYIGGKRGGEIRCKDIYIGRFGKGAGGGVRERGEKVSEDIESMVACVYSLSLAVGRSSVGGGGGLE